MATTKFGIDWDDWTDADELEDLAAILLGG